MKPAVVLGDVNVDLVIALPDRSRGQLDLTGSVPQLFGGGTAGNAAVGIARLGLPVRFIGAVGDDGYGRWIAADFDREGIDTGALRVLRDSLTPMVLALVEPSGERLIVVWPPERGADTQLEPEMVDPQAIQSAGWLHTTGMCLRASPVREAVLHGLRLANHAGVPTSLDLNLRIELWGYPPEVRRVIEEAVSLADVVFGNGAEEIVPVAGVDSVEAAAVALSAGQRVVIARLGAEGAFAAAPEGTARVPAFPTTVVDTLGAGDAFDAGFIAARMQGLPLAEALRWGNAVAACKLQGKGARTLPDRAALRRVLSG